MQKHYAISDDGTRMYIGDMVIVKDRSLLDSPRYQSVYSIESMGLSCTPDNNEHFTVSIRDIMDPGSAIHIFSVNISPIQDPRAFIKLNPL